MNKPSVKIIEKEEIFKRAFFRWFRVRFEYDRFDGQRVGPIEQVVLDRGNSVAILLHDVPANEIILVEQLRVATTESGSGWILELPAGRVDPNEDPKLAALRETKEETGVEPTSIELVSSFFLSPGGCSERISLYYCPFEDGLVVEASGGLAQENEDIRVHRSSLVEALAMVDDGRIADAKTIVGLLWLARRTESPG